MLKSFQDSNNELNYYFKILMLSAIFDYAGSFNIKKSNQFYARFTFPTIYSDLLIWLINDNIKFNSISINDKIVAITIKNFFSLNNFLIIILFGSFSRALHH